MKYVDVVSKSPELKLKWTEHHQQKNKTEKFSNWMIKEENSLECFWFYVEY